MEEHLSLAEAAERMGISERTARRWIKSGKLRASKPGRDYWIPESALTKLVEESEVSPKGSGRSSLEPSLLNGLEEERRRLRVQLLRELKEHADDRADGYRRDLARLTAERPSAADWERLERKSGFDSILAHYLLQDESGAPEGLQSEPERRVWRAAHESVQALDVVCDEIEVAATSAREVAGLEESEGIRALGTYRKRAG